MWIKSVEKCLKNAKNIPLWQLLALTFPYIGCTLQVCWVQSDQSQWLIHWCMRLFVGQWCWVLHWCGMGVVPVYLDNALMHYPRVAGSYTDVSSAVKSIISPVVLALTLMYEQCNTRYPGSYTGYKITILPVVLVPTPVYGQCTICITGSYTTLTIPFLEIFWWPRIPKISFLGKVLMDKKLTAEMLKFPLHNRHHLILHKSASSLV